jgi:hypothetical protein
MKKMILKTLTSFVTDHKDSTNRAPLLPRWFLVPPVLVFFALLPGVQATPEGPAVPKAPQQAPAAPEILEGAPAAPNIALAGFNTADGDHALFNITTGSANSAFGWFSLFSDTDASFNTGVGAGTLLSIMQTTIRLLGLRRFYSTPPAPIIPLSESWPLRTTPPATATRPMEHSRSLAI